MLNWSTSFYLPIFKCQISFSRVSIHLSYISIKMHFSNWFCWYGTVLFCFNYPHSERRLPRNIQLNVKKRWALGQLGWLYWFDKITELYDQFVQICNRFRNCKKYVNISIFCGISYSLQKNTSTDVKKTIYL